MTKNIDRMTTEELEEAIRDIGQQQEALREKKLTLAHQLDAKLLEERAAAAADSLTDAELDALVKHATARANLATTRSNAEGV